MIPKAAFNTIEIDDKKGGKRGDKKGERPNRNFDKPPTTGCRFCAGMHREKFCEAREEASKAYREKNGLPPHVPPADNEESKRPPKKKVTLDLTKKEMHTTVVASEDETTTEGSNEAAFEELNRLMNEFPDEYGQFFTDEFPDDFHECDEEPREQAAESYQSKIMKSSFTSLFPHCQPESVKVTPYPDYLPFLSKLHACCVKFRWKFLSHCFNLLAKN